jgi:hypothetical protein
MTATEERATATVADMRLLAQRLEQENPSWIVLYGAYSKEFVAFPRFTAPSGTIVVGRHPSTLPTRLRQIEQQAERAGARPS